MNIYIDIPKNVKEIGELLERHGHETYIVGGCVRDAILGKTPKDWDITTAASIDEISSILSKNGATTLDIKGSLEHGVCFVLYHGEQYEIATFRKDGEYQDGRHCNVIIDGVSLKEDLCRRDFTINAMAMRITTNEFVDLFGGVEDCQNKILRAVGNASERINEDALRILRAFRFSAQLGFAMDEEIVNAIQINRDSITKVSYERISNEFNKIICSDNFERVLLEMYKLGVLAIILPEFSVAMNCEQHNPHHIYNVGMHCLKTMQYVPNTLEMRWAALLHDMGKVTTIVRGDDGYDHFPNHAKESERIAGNVLRRYKFDNDFIFRVCTLIDYHDEHFLTKKSIRRFLGKYGEEMLRLELCLRKADVLAQNPNFQMESKLDIVENSMILIDEVLLGESDNVFSLKDMEISGNDLIAIGFRQGKELGATLNELFEMVLEDPSLNDNSILVQIAKAKL